MVVTVIATLSLLLRLGLSAKLAARFGGSRRSIASHVQVRLLGT